MNQLHREKDDDTMTRPTGSANKPMGEEQPCKHHRGARSWGLLSFQRSVAPSVGNETEVARNGGRHGFETRSEQADGFGPIFDRSPSKCLRLARDCVCLSSMFALLRCCILLRLVEVTVYENREFGVLGEEHLDQDDLGEGGGTLHSRTR